MSTFLYHHAFTFFSNSNLKLKYPNKTKTWATSLYFCIDEKIW
jgi:hypothetical protein